MNNYVCICCNYKTFRIDNFKRHNKSKRHLGKLNEISQKNTKDSTILKTSPQLSHLSHNVSQFVSLDDSDDSEETEKQIKYVCKYCNKEFENRNKKWRHQKSCSKIGTEKLLTSLFDPNIISMNSNVINNPPNTAPNGSDNITKTEILDIVKNYQQQMESLISMASQNVKVAVNASDAIKSTTETANKSMHMMKYAMTHFKDAPPLLPLNKEQVFKMLNQDKSKSDKLDSDSDKDSSNSDFSSENDLKPVKINEKTKKGKNIEKKVKPMLNHFDNKTIPSFFGKMIVKYFNKEKGIDRQFWSADVARLSFILMQQVNKKGEKEWVTDKSGKKFTSMVITPMFDVVYDLLDDYIDFIQNKIKNMKIVQPYYMDSLMEIQQKTRELQLEIKYEKFNRDILKFVAPYFNFDTYRKNLDRHELEIERKNTVNDSDSNESTDIKPTKIPKFKGKYK